MGRGKRKEETKNPRLPKEPRAIIFPWVAGNGAGRYFPISMATLKPRRLASYTFFAARQSPMG